MGQAKPASDPRRKFQQGELALKGNRLEEAEKHSRAVPAANPQLAGHTRTWCLVYMRRKQWKPARAMLDKAPQLAPGVPGIRLNIGLLHYRQSDFRSAIPAFASVVKDAPDSFQARYLLGLRYFLTEHYSEAATTLEPLWWRAADQLNYLYALGIAAGKSGQPDIEQRSLARLLEIGQNSAELHC
jgi:tetratricopeptide (TPR) repeat protein